DGDGWLDLVIVNFIDFDAESLQHCSADTGVRRACHPQVYPPERGEIWRNTGRGSFERVPVAQGMDTTHGLGLVLAFVDIDGDGRLDFYIGNDGVPSDFLHNLGSMRFENIAGAAGLETNASAVALSVMGADWGDFNRDSRLDLVVTSFQSQSFV